MNINRHNYEELFLLYVDNELSEADRTSVEIFVQQNPDLGEELSLLQQSTLMPEETVSFLNKESLYKNEHSINLSNCDEYFLLHVDNELSAKEKEDVEKFVLQNPQVQDEFTVLQKTKLQPDIVEFKDKASLYRTEKRAARIISLSWMRVAAAAAVIGIVATFWITYSDNADTAQPPVATVVKKDEQKEQPIQKDDRQKEVEIEEPAATETSQEQIASVDKPQSVKQPASVERKVVKKVENENVVITAISTKKESPLPDKENLNNLPKPENNPYVRNNNGNRTVKQSNVERFTETAANSQNSLVNNTKPTDSKSYVQQAVLKEIDTEEGEEEKILYIGGAQINKNKLRGLFKKAASLLDKTIKKPEIEKSIQIADYEIKTK